MDNTIHDVIVVGGGHNGLVAAAYLAKAGKEVLVLEANDIPGGASTSARAFPEYDARLSRYAYLVSLLPDPIIRDLGLKIPLLSREIMSYTPFREGDRDTGLLIARNWDEQTQASFHGIRHGRKDAIAWRAFYEEIGHFASKVAPSLLEPLPTRQELKRRTAMGKTWDFLLEKPIGEEILSRFQNDYVRGIALTDALIGTFTPAHTMQANACFLYHLIGNGTGEWKVPQGGMGALVDDLVRVVKESGAAISLGSRAVKVETAADRVTVFLADGRRVMGRYLLCNAAPQVLARLRGLPSPKSLEGSQLKVNMLVRELPQFRSGADPVKAFSGTLHIHESYTQLEQAYKEASIGQVPTPLPLEIYCHTLTDPSILSPDLQEKGFHTLTLFGLHTPAALFEKQPEVAKRNVRDAAIHSLNAFLTDPLDSFLARNSAGELCLEVKTPLDLEAEIGLPRGNIFHKDLSFPFREENEPSGWGVETKDPRILLCGAGARRGGGVSGIPGHNAAMALLESPFD